MCLELKNSRIKAKIATKDIVCYKGLIKKDNIYYTPYQNCIIEIGNTYKSNIIKEGNEINIGLHSFVTIEDLKPWSVRGMGTWGKLMGYIKCIIPKGSKYYIGIFGKYNSYVSDTLQYIEIID